MRISYAFDKSTLRCTCVLKVSCKCNFYGEIVHYFFVRHAFDFQTTFQCDSILCCALKPKREVIKKGLYLREHSIRRSSKSCRYFLLGLRCHKSFHKSYFCFGDTSFFSMYLKCEVFRGREGRSKHFELLLETIAFFFISTSAN